MSTQVNITGTGYATGAGVGIEVEVLKVGFPAGFSGPGTLTIEAVNGDSVLLYRAEGTFSRLSGGTGYVVFSNSGRQLSSGFDDGPEIVLDEGVNENFIVTAVGAPQGTILKAHLTANGTC